MAFPTYQTLLRSYASLPGGFAYHDQGLSGRFFHTLGEFCDKIFKFNIDIIYVYYK